MGVAEELASMNFGEGLANALAKIGQTVKESRDENRIKAISGTVLANVNEAKDLLTPEFMNRYQSVVGELQNLVGGDKAIAQINQALQVPIALDQQRRSLEDDAERQFTSEFGPLVNPISTGIAQYNADLGNMDKSLADKKHSALMSQITALESNWGKHPRAKQIIDNLRNSLVTPQGLSTEKQASIGYKNAQAAYQESRGASQAAMADYYKNRSSKEVLLQEAISKKDALGAYKIVGDLMQGVNDLRAKIVADMTQATMFGDTAGAQAYQKMLMELEENLSTYRTLMNDLSNPTEVDPEEIIKKMPKNIKSPNSIKNYWGDPSIPTDTPDSSGYMQRELDKLKSQ